MDMNMFMDEFVSDISEILENLELDTIELEKNGKDKEILNRIFRSFHSLKGMCGTMGFHKMESTSHLVEDLIQDIREDKIESNQEIIDVILYDRDIIEKLYKSIMETGKEKEIETETEELKLKLDKIRGINDDKKDDKKSRDMATNRVKIRFIGDSYKKDMISSALKMGLKLHEMTIKLNKNSDMPLVRGFMVYSSILKEARIIYSNPSYESLLEGEEVEETFDFKVIFTTNKKIIDLKNRVRKLVDVESIKVSEVIEYGKTIKDKYLINEEWESGSFKPFTLEEIVEMTDEFDYEYEENLIKELKIKISSSDDKKTDLMFMQEIYSRLHQIENIFKIYKIKLLADIFKDLKIKFDNNIKNEKITENIKKLIISGCEFSELYLETIGK
ncbi:Hpt domain-containing protein [Haliovirga abyssi]|uniref:HPt domain-containing protein n=1 Tax=Haliovirga abyssi TaxID=2996794 RepID=A0AAU9DIL7_9FUSO|nr:Hpt domain-containing protein [Haliovirga abyssi]BDU49632.1 hypothetical protein HLVA_02010 [Haliovirga abyssi]